MSKFKGTLPPGYEVDCEGRVFADTGWRGYGVRELTQDLNSHGYPSVRVTFPDGRRKRLFVHTLVAEYHLPPRPTASHEVCHIDGDRTNNRADNLRWGTRKDNAADREAHGRTSRGEKHSMAVIRSGKGNFLTDEERRRILMLMRSGHSINAISKIVGRAYGTVKSAIAKALGEDAT